MWRGLVFSAMAVVAGGCSLLVGTDGLTSSTVDDAGPGDAGPNDAPSDTVVAESAADAVADAPIDAGVDAAPVPFCASLVPAPKYCADFDTGMPTDYGRVVGAVTFDTGEAKSPPRSLLATVAATAAAGDRSCEIAHGFADTPSAYEGGFDVLVDALDTAHDVELITVYLTQGPDQSCVTDVSIRGGFWTFDESCSEGGVQGLGKSHVSPKHVVLGSWIHVDYAVSFPAATFSLSVAGEVLFAAAPIDPALLTGKVDLFMGITYLSTPATSTATVHVDNVRFDYK